MSPEQITKPRAANVKHERTLFEFVEPLLILFKGGKRFFIATAMPSDCGFVEAYLAVSVTPTILKRYLQQEVDLRFVFTIPKNRSFYTVKSELAFEEKVKLSPFVGILLEEYLPEKHFFAVEHTSKYSLGGTIGSDRQELYIDGHWEMEDFGKFSSRYRDMYSFEDSLMILLDPNAANTRQKKVAAAFNGNDLTGGGSYKKLFGDLLAAQPANERYGLKKVKYASPGNIELAGRADLFNCVRQRIETVLKRRKELQKKYKKLRDYMSGLGLLDIQASIYSADEKQSMKIEEMSRKLMSELSIDGYDTIKLENDNSVINAAKICLAICRRLQAAADFFAEGRIAYI